VNNPTEVEEYLRTLAPLGAKGPVDTREMWHAHHEKKYGEVLGAVLRSLQIDCHVVLAKVNRAPERYKYDPAWFEVLLPLPHYGTRQFRETRITIHVWKQTLEQLSFTDLLHLYVHECCHILLLATQHKFANDERAVELCGMLLGYAEVYVNSTLFKTDNILAELLSLIDRMGNKPIYHYGSHLTRDEVRHAHKVITRMRQTPARR
jgi:hypothetical protein